MEKSVFYPLILLCFFGLSSLSSAIAQSNFLSVNLNHPIPVGGEFYSDFNGIAGIDINYIQPLNEVLFISGNIGYSRSRSTKEHDINLNVFQVKLGVTKPFKVAPQFEIQPQLDLGYAYLKFFNETIALYNKTSSYRIADSKVLSGSQTTLSLSLNYLLTDKFSIGLATGYEFTYIPRKNLFGKYHQEMHGINLGIKSIIKL